jgi:hypothetical protein
VMTRSVLPSGAARTTDKAHSGTGSAASVSRERAVLLNVRERISVGSMRQRWPALGTRPPLKAVTRPGLESDGWRSRRRVISVRFPGSSGSAEASRLLPD